MKLYKFVTPDFTTRNNTVWSPSITNTANGEGTELCSDGFLHGYSHPLLAVFLRSLHVPGNNTVLIEVESSESAAHDGLIHGTKQQRMIRVVETPTITLDQRVEIAIRLALTLDQPESFRAWAGTWLSGEDRSAGSEKAESTLLGIIEEVLR
jgi:hypothetical protein